MFSYFGGSRFSSYGRPDSSDDEEETSRGFRLNRGGEESSAAAAGAHAGAGPVTAGNIALAAALDDDSAPVGRIALETEADGQNVDDLVAKQLAFLCIECTDQPATVVCQQCTDRFCDVCFAAMHKRGTRATHTTTPFAEGKKLDGVVSSSSTAAAVAAAASAASDAASAMDEEASPAAPAAAAVDAQSVASADDIDDNMLEQSYARGQQAAAATASSAGVGSKNATSALSDDSNDDDDDASSQASGASAASGKGIVLPSRAMQSSLVSGSGRMLANGLPADWFLERAQFIPLRLTLEERKFLRLLESTLNVSEYTDKVDVISSRAKAVRIKEQLRDICSILSGLVVANDYKLGQQLITDKEFADNEEFFKNVFELGRRHKIRNPEKMRNGYGKMVYVIQDSVMPHISELMGFDLHGDLKTVYRTLEAGGALDVLRDERMMLATGDIKTEGRQRPEIERDIKQKEAAVAYLAKRYSNAKMDVEAMRACILSIADNHTFLIQNRHCCDEMLKWLTENYPSDNASNPAHSLAILGGRAGARLTHSHANQFAYVMQSLTLWREILHDMFRLWCMCEADLFNPNSSYSLRSTGQGLNRIQQAPNVGRAMHNILAHCQRKLGHWVGSSVIHLGDHNVPNALNFIDKYTQVSRILNPIVLTIKAIPRLCEKPDIKFYIDRIFGGAEALKMLILTDCFRHMFDGSGADNFFDAGSCIDGRLTSAWNWCSKIEKKSYYTIFQLAGFSSFDGQWSD